MSRLTRDGAACLTISSSQARMGTEKILLSLLASHEQDWQRYPVDPYSAEVLTLDIV